MQVNRSVAWVGLGCIVLCWTGCVPVRVWDVPEVKGTVHRGATPLVNAKVVWLNLRLGTTEPPKPAGQAVTNGRGQFEMQPVTRHAAGILLPAHALSESVLQIESDGKTERLWHYKFYGAGPRSAPRRAVLDCDLDLVRPCALLDTDNRWLSKADRLAVE
jgi:hypothetical protein